MWHHCCEGLHCAVLHPEGALAYCAETQESHAVLLSDTVKMGTKGRLTVWQIRILYPSVCVNSTVPCCILNIPL